MRTRLLALLTCAAASVGTALVAVQPAEAAFSYKVYDMCADDADGQQCVVSATRNDVPITSDYPSTPGVHEWFYVDNGWRNGINGFNLNTITVPESGPPTASKSVDAEADWVITVNTGPYKVRELNAKTRNTVFTTGGSPGSGGYWFRIEFNPVPVAWRWDDGPYGCDMTDCGTDATVAEFVSDPGKGFADGYVTDLADFESPRYVAARTGFVLASNAQYQREPYYDSVTNSIVVEMANPHLRAPGVQATGFFETFLPNAYLLQQLEVPYPATLTGGSFTVRRAGTTTSTPFSLTHTSTGIWIRVHDIGFSRPKFRVTPKPKPPGMPRLTGVTKLTGAARSSFLPPIADGGKPVDKYQARCHKAGGTWHYQLGTKSPITVTSLPPGTVYCQVRAHNVIGWGLWGKAGAS